MKLSFENKIRLGFGSGLVFLLLTSGAAYWSATRSLHSFRQVEHTERVLDSLRNTLATMLDVKTGTRDFIITGGRQFLDPLKKGRKAVERQMARLRSESADSPLERHDLARIEPLIGRVFSSQLDLVSARTSNGFGSAAAKISNGSEKGVMTHLRSRIAEMEAHEHELLAQESSKATETFHTTILVVSISGALALLVVGLAGGLARVDYDKRRRAEEERDRFFTLSRDLLCLASFDGHFKRLNPAWENTLGFSCEELLSKPFIEWVHPEDRAETLAQAEQLAHGGEVVHFENRYLARDGTYRWLSWNARSSAADRMICGTARDVTLEKQAHEQIGRLNAALRSHAAKLEASEERFRMMVEGVKDYAILMLNAEGRIVSWNSGAERIKGYRADEIVGQHFSRFYPEADVLGGKPGRALAVAASAGQYEEQGWRVRKDGSRFWASVLLTALRNEAGELRGFVKVTRDITERRRAEEQIIKLNDAVCRRAAELEAANKELEAFSYSVSHDLRAPLRHIDGFVGRLTQTAGSTLDAKSRRYLSIISESAKHMGELIDDLLVFSRMGRAEMRTLAVDLESLTRAVIVELEPETQVRDIVWKNGSLPEVHGDPSMLRLVLANLLGNAVKYTRTRDCAEIEIGCLDEPRETVIFVRDNGVGFEMEYVHKLFGVFQRLHRSDEFEGTGIGLASVRRIIHRHGGRTWAEGKPDCGATFYFSLPKQTEPTT